MIPKTCVSTEHFKFRFVFNNWHIEFLILIYCPLVYCTISLYISQVLQKTEPIGWLVHACVCVRVCVCMRVCGHPCVCSFILRNWLKSKIFSVGWQAGDPRRSRCCSSSLKANYWQDSSIAQGKSIFCSMQGFHWLDKAHPHYGGWSICFSQSLMI